MSAAKNISEISDKKNGSDNVITLFIQSLFLHSCISLLSGLGLHSLLKHALRLFTGYLPGRGVLLPVKKRTGRRNFPPA
jgi:hypothetical protein